jgi:hypothetical protein
MSDVQLAGEETGGWTDADQDIGDEFDEVHPKRTGGKNKLFVVAALAVVAGSGWLYAAHMRGIHAVKGLTASQLNGTWALSSNAIAQFPGVMKQSVQFSNGTVSGTTVLKADSPSGVSRLPFPDHSVDNVKESGDGYKLTATWHGTYKVLTGNRVDLTIGKAGYTLGAAFNPKTHSLTFSHDILLTGGSKTVYSAS